MIETRKDWLMWRKQGLGASDIPIVMGKSRFKTPLDLYEEKTSNEIQEESSYITDKGNKMEEQIRALYELVSGKTYKPGLCVMADFDFIRASLDGWSEDKTQILEIKLLAIVDSSKELNTEAEGYVKWLALKEKGIVPEDYIDQVQTQLMASNAKECIFIGLKEDKQKDVISLEDLAITIVKPDLERQFQIVNEAEKFWNDHIVKKKPPKETEKDYKNLTGFKDKVAVYKKLTLEIDKLSENLDSIKEEILTAAKENGHPRILCSGLKIQKIERIGNVDYKKIPELKNVDLDKYRAKSSTYYKVSVEK